MNPLPAPDHPTRHLAPALLLAVAVLAFPCASAGAGCRPHRSRPTISPESLAAARPAPPGRAPGCSGPSCSRGKPTLPIASRVKAIPRVEPLPGPPDRRAADTLLGRVTARREDLSPIGRVVDVDRPPRPLA